MNLTELNPVLSSKRLSESYAKQFGKGIDVSGLPRKQAIQMLNKTRGKIVEYKQSANAHTRETDPVYNKLMVLEQALTARVNETEEKKMNIKNITQNKKSAFVNAVKEAAQGKAVNKASLRSMGISESLLKVVESQESAAKFMKTVVSEKRKCKENKARLQEGEVDQAQVVLAAQDMVDQVQKMIENMSDLKVKELPALADGIRGQMGTEQSESFKSQAGAALDSLISNLSTAKEELNAATGILTGEELSVPGEDDMELDVDSGMDVEPEMGAEPDLDLDAEMDALDEPEGDLGRERIDV
jgi:hypothetical protein